MVINNFKDAFAFLSNMYPCNIVYNNLTYKCSEAAFQAQKCIELAYQFTTINGFEAKKLGKKVPLRKDWNEIRLQIMYEIVKQKFIQNKSLKDKLIATQDAELIEGNYWGDIFWGVCTNKTYNNIGENHLGKILMQVRDEIK